MNRLADLLPADHILLDIDARTKPVLFARIGEMFDGRYGVSAATIADSLSAREMLGSTGLGAGVAIPHGRIKGLRQQVAAFVRLAEPMEFGSPDGKPVQLLFFLLVPEQATQAHLETLSALAQLLSDRGVRAALSSEADAEGIQAKLRDAAR